MTEPRYIHLWDNPRVRLEGKMSILRELLPDINSLVINLGGVLIARGRLGLVADIVSEYERLVDAHYGIEHAEVTASIPLDEVTQEKLAQGLSQALDKKVSIKVKIDPGIIGGMVVKVGDRVVDGSVKSRLESLRRSLVTM